MTKLKTLNSRQVLHFPFFLPLSQVRKIFLSPFLDSMTVGFSNQHTYIFQQIYSTKTAKARVVSTLASLLWAGAILNNQPSFDLTESSIITCIQLHSQFNCADQSSRRSVRRFRRSGLKHMHTVNKNTKGNTIKRSHTSSTYTALFS